MKKHLFLLFLSFSCLTMEYQPVANKLIKISVGKAACRWKEFRLSNVHKEIEYCLINGIKVFCGKSATFQSKGSITITPIVKIVHYSKITGKPFKTIFDTLNEVTIKHQNDLPLQVKFTDN